jgi:cell division ATPase FtsA
MPLLSFFKTQKEEVSLLIDIGTGSIGAAVVRFQKGQKPAILHSIRSAFAVGDMQSRPQLLVDATEALSDVLARLMQAAFDGHARKGAQRKIQSVHISFSCPWFVSRTKRVQRENLSEFAVTAPFVESVVAEEAKLFQQEIVSGDQQAVFEGEPRIVEKAIVHATINGYSLRDVIGKKAKAFDAYICLAAISQETIGSIADAIFAHTHVPREHMTFHTFPVVALSAICTIAPESTDFLMMDVTGETTDLTLVRDGILLQTVSFPSGRNFVLRQVGKAFGISPEIAESSLRLCTEGKTDDETARQMDVAMADVEKEWSIYFENALSELDSAGTPARHASQGKVGRLPSMLYLTSDGDVAGMYQKFLGIKKTDGTAAFRQNLSVTRMSDELLGPLVSRGSTVPEDEFISMLALFTHFSLQ